MASTTKILANPDLPVADAVKAWYASIPSHDDDDKLEEELWESWGTLIQFTTTVPPAEQGRLIEFVQALQSTGPPGAKSTDTIKAWGEDVPWSQLPYLGPILREHWTYSPDDEDSMHWTKDGRWENLNAFVAQLTTLSKGAKDSALNLSLYGLWALRDALEESKLGDSVDVTLANAAAVWIIYAGEVLRALSAEGRRFEDKLGKAGEDLHQKKEWVGFSEERWKVWTERMCHLKLEVKDEADQKRIEQKLVDQAATSIKAL